MTDQIQLAAELGAAASEMKSASAMVGGMKSTIEALQKQVADLEQGQTKGAEDMGKLCSAIDKLDRKARIAGAGGGSKAFAPEAFKQFADYLATGAPMETKAVSEQSDAAGRAALPLHINDFVQDQLTEINPMRRLAYTVQTDSPNFRHLINVKGATSRWGEEIDVRQDTDTPQLAKVEPRLFEHYAYA